MKRLLCIFLLAFSYLKAEPEFQPDTVFHITGNINNCVDDPHELEQYIASFPKQDYITCYVPYQGKFYVEPNRHDTIKNVLRSGERWEPHILLLINKYAKPGTVVLDIGSHIGTFTMAMSKAVGDSGTVYAFEPQRKIYRELRKNCELNGIKNAVCHRLAIGDQPQIIEMDIETYPGSEGSTGIGGGGDRAEMRTIDSFNFTNVSFVKLDVERSEEQVLDGMVNTILKNKPVIAIELQGGYLWESAPPDIKQKMINSIEKLEKLGYVVTRVYLHDYLAVPTN
jgi:FkbM family methyltransferase